MKYLGIDIGGTNIKWVVLNDQNEILDQNQMSTEDNADQKEIWKSKIIELVKQKTQAEKDIQIGISAPGLTDDENECILNMPGRLIGLERYMWSAELNVPIKVINDAHSACFAEFESFYREENIENILLLTLGTGVGGGVILNGKLFQGNINRAGHFGHMTVDHMGSPIQTNMVGSLEYAIGNFSVSKRTLGKYQSTRDLVKSYLKGESLATYWWLSSVQKLATALASLTNAFSPELIILGGGIAAGAGDDLLNPLHDFMSLYEWQPDGYRVKIVKAKHDQFAGAIGAALFVKSQMV